MLWDKALRVDESLRWGAQQVGHCEACTLQSGRGDEDAQFGTKTDNTLRS